MSPSLTSELGLPSASMVIPIILPFAGALTPVASSPYISAAIPRVILVYTLGGTVYLFSVQGRVFLLLQGGFHDGSFESVLIP